MKMSSQSKNFVIDQKSSEMMAHAQKTMSDVEKAYMTYITASRIFEMIKSNEK